MISNAVKLAGTGPTQLLWPTTTVAVTGGSGFVGRHLVRALSQRCMRMVVVDLAEPPDGERLPNVEYIHADLRNHDEVLLALAGVDLVFHLAGNASGSLSVENPRFDFEVNALGACNVGTAAAQAGVRRLVYLSSAIVYGTPEQFPISEDHRTRPFLPYGASKLSGELTLRSLHDAIGLPVIVGRAFVIYGPGEDPRRAGGEVSQFLRWHLNGEAIPVAGDIDRKTRDFIHVDDLVNALLTLADRGREGEVYNLGSGEEISMRGLAQAVARVTGRPVELRVNPDLLEDSFRLVADIGRLRELGFRPRVSLDDGLALLVTELGDAPELPSAKAIFRRSQLAATGPKERAC